MKFTYNDFLKVFSGKQFVYEQVFNSMRTIDSVALLKIGESCKDFRIGKAFAALRDRINEEYYYKIYPTQCAAMSYSRTAFPPYRYILPDVLTEDWLALMDYHKDFSRDHCIHQPLTAYIVHLLLGGGNEAKALEINNKSILTSAVEILRFGNKTKYLRDYLSQLSPNSRLLSYEQNDNVASYLWKELFYETAITAALFHDTGYPWQYVGRLRGSIAKNDFNLPIEDLNVHHIFNTFRSRLVMYPFSGYANPIYNTPAGWDKRIHELIKQSIVKTHGFPGALGFLYLNDLVRKSPSSKGEELSVFCYDWAALGIMMHDMVKIYQGGNNTAPKNTFLRLDFEQDPLSCIIAIADVLEDFCRPSALFRRNGDNSVSINYSVTTDSTEIESIGDVMNISYHFDSLENANYQRVFKEKEITEYFDPIIGYIDISSLGLKRVICKCD